MSKEIRGFLRNSLPGFFILIILLTIFSFTLFLVYPLNLLFADEMEMGPETPEDGADEITAYTRDISYEDYLLQFHDIERPDREIIISADSFVDSDMDIDILQNFEDYHNKAVATEEVGYVEWEIEIEEAGFYNIALDYYPIEGRSIAIERELKINGETPFRGAGYLLLNRIWTDGHDIMRDDMGNEIRPSQVEAPDWMTYILRDSLGYHQKPYKFYFPEGKNTIRVVSRAEPMVLGDIRLFQRDEILDYTSVLEKYEEKGYEPAEGFKTKIQGQDAIFRSHSTLFPVNDQGDPTIEPYHPAEIRLNSIGGHRWDQPGQWIRWEFEVPEDGLYQIAIKGKQDQVRGFFSNRKVLLNGEVPFRELKAVRFPYSGNYSMYQLGPEDQDEPFLIYLPEGKHYLELEVVLGGISDLLLQAEECLYELNTIYRNIIMLTGRNPDPLRNYQLELRIPGIIERLGELGEIIEGMGRELEDYTGQKDSHIAVLYDLSRMLHDLADDPVSIPGNIAAYRDNTAALGGWLMQSREQPLQIDYLVVASPEQELPRPNPTTMQTLLHEIRALSASFTHDYDQIGSVVEADELRSDFNGESEISRKLTVEEPLNVWIGTGRDQAQSLKIMMEDSFTPETGIPVHLQLIAGMQDILLPATLSGEGPDVALGAQVGAPINYALRGGVYDLSQFDDFDEVASRFMKSALVSFRYRDRVYALPEQHAFPMLFYRKDVLEELNVEIPNTWDEVFDLIPVLRNKHMEFGLPQGFGSMQTFLYQRGVPIYKEDGVKTNMGSPVFVEEFRKLTNLFRLHNLPFQYDAANRFRMGEMPILISDYGLYNMLSVFAPELRGEWGFTLIPGTMEEDGTINRTLSTSPAGMALQQAGVGGPAVMIMAPSDMKDEAWEFLKWWTQADTQVRFGLELEALMGAAARYPTSNIEALKQLPWTAPERELLLEQWEWVEGTPQVPGSYYAQRMFDFAFRAVVINDEPYRETLIEYDRRINAELRQKREEFGLELRLEDIDEKYKELYWDHYTHLDRLE